jgi:hypothetical protein
LFTTVLANAVSQAAPAGPPVLTWSPETNGAYAYPTLDAGAGATQPVTFTLTNTGDRAPGVLTIGLTGSSAFTITADGCTGTSIGPNPPDNSCSVTVQYAPTTSGQSDSATLAADSKQGASTSITLTGKSGTPDLTLIPGTLGTNTHYGTGEDPNGTKYYSDDFKLVSAGNPKTVAFTVKNSPTATGTSFPLQLAGCTPSCNTGFTLNDQTSGQKLKPGDSATFDLTFTVPPSTVPPSCPPPTLFAQPLLVTSTNTKESPYISMINSANCGPPVTSVTAAPLNNATFPGNPEFVTSSSRSLQVNGTLTNHSFSPPVPPVPAGRLHGFTVQIPFSLTAGTLTCDTSSVNGVTLGGATCGVSNNVLTVTENFTALNSFFNWAPGGPKSIGYGYVGSQGPAFVTFGTPIVTAVN